MSTTPTEQAPNLAERLKTVRVGVRHDLEVSRHVFRGEPTYIIRDPMTFQSHRLDPQDYVVFVSIDPGRTLGETFERLVEREVFAEEDSEQFYAFVFTLHKLGFLSLPISNHQLLFQRFMARKKAQRKQKITGFLFLQVPLVNPDAFLTRTLPFVRWAYSRTFFLVWTALLCAAGYVGAMNWSALIEPANGLLATNNLPVMWITLVGLKILHEFGHAYACKHFGGHVPEMGAYLIAGTPCAYVDATAAWGFPSKLHRLAVSLAGVYIEVLIAAIAVLIWAALEPGLLRSALYNVIFLASAVTLLFNINPLMRYDGYYVASDTLEIPNLRARSMQYVQHVLKRVFLGINDGSAPEGAKLKAILFSFGVFASLYRVTVLVAIAALVATKLLYLGLALAAYFILGTLYGVGHKLANYLWVAEETARVRPRAIAVGVAAFALLPLGVVLIPLPARVIAAGNVVAENETVVRAGAPGFTSQIHVQRGAHVQAGQTLVCLDDIAADEQLLAAQAELDAAQLRLAAYESSDPAAAQQELARVAFAKSELAHAAELKQRLLVRAPEPGRVVSVLKPTDLGRHLALGDPIATVTSGDWLARIILSEHEFAAATPHVGDRVRFRVSAHADEALDGVIQSIKPVGTRHVDLEALTHAAGGNVVVDPMTGETTQPYFEIVLRLDADAADAVRHGMTGTVCLPAKSEPLGTHIYRGVARFTNSLLRS